MKNKYVVTHGDANSVEAQRYATYCHIDQVRKYTVEPYTVHLQEVVEYLRLTDLAHNEVALSAAWLHDVVEDCGVSLGTITLMFGASVAHHVDILSELLTPAEGNRKYRKMGQLQRLERSSYITQSIKYADLLSNWPSIYKHDKNFAAVYRREALDLVEAMKGGNQLLRRLLRWELLAGGKY